MFYFNSCVKQRVLSANFAAKMKSFLRLIHTQHSVRNAEPCSTSKYFFCCLRWLAVKILYYASNKFFDVYLIFLSFAEYVSNLECVQNANEDRKDLTQVSLDGDLLRVCMGYS